ncbi:MAG: hypothetical protein GXO75_08405 [Calditrichaeota bacterium]|nr:hypothetical protein [Calditrichota bacterium]
MMYYIYFADGPEEGRKILKEKAPEVLEIYSKDGELLIYRKVNTTVRLDTYPVCIYEIEGGDNESEG